MSGNKINKKVKKALEKGDIDKAVTLFENKFTEPRLKARKTDTSEESVIWFDFLEHFPKYPELILFILAARFSYDRKKSYLWMRAESDFGKSFIFDAVFGEIGLTAHIKETELKGAISGTASGLDLEQFVHAWILLFEEFKGAVSELKDITHSIHITPKFGNKTQVDVYAKIMLSAETVPSLINENGVEKQFANRIAFFDLKGRLPDRPVFKKNAKLYADVIRSMTYEILQKNIALFVKELGETQTNILCDNLLKRFHARNPLVSEHGEQVDIMDTVHEKLKQYLTNVSHIVDRGSVDKPEVELSVNFAETVKNLYFIKDNEVYTYNLGLAREHFINSTFSKSEQGVLNKKSSAELLISHRTSFRVNGIKKNVYILNATWATH